MNDNRKIPQPRIVELDGLRALAILAVLGDHYVGYARLLGGLPQFGWIGVDIFFCLSGFLITGVLLNLKTKSTPYRTFYSRRAIRILPPYWLSFAVVFAIGLFSHRYAVCTPGFLKQQMLFLQALTRAQVKAVWDSVIHPRWQLRHAIPLLQNAHHLPAEISLPPMIGSPAATYWSLSVEEYFYLLWAPVVLRLRSKGIATVGVTICVAEMVLRFMSLDTRTSYVGLCYRLDAPVYGALLALLLTTTKGRINTHRQRRLFGGLLLSCMVAFGAILSRLSPVVGRNVRDSQLFMVFGLPLLSLMSVFFIGLLTLSAGSDWLPARLLRSGPMRYLGTISYTMYLAHMWIALLVSEAFPGGTSRTASNGSTLSQA